MIRYYKNFRLIDNSVYDGTYKVSLEFFVNGILSSTNIQISKEQFDMLSDMLSNFNNLVKEFTQNGK